MPDPHRNDMVSCAGVWNRCLSVGTVIVAGVCIGGMYVAAAGIFVISAQSKYQNNTNLLCFIMAKNIADFTI